MRKSFNNGQSLFHQFSSVSPSLSLSLRNFHTFCIIRDEDKKKENSLIHVVVQVGALLSLSYRTYSHSTDELFPNIRHLRLFDYDFISIYLLYYILSYIITLINSI